MTPPIKTRGQNCQHNLHQITSQSRKPKASDRYCDSQRRLTQRTPFQPDVIALSLLLAISRPHFSDPFTQQNTKPSRKHSHELPRTKFDPTPNMHLDALVYETTHATPVPPHPIPPASNASKNDTKRRKNRNKNYSGYPPQPRHAIKYNFKPRRTMPRARDGNASL